jgi:NADH-quinone oxidoreductase subunit E
MIEMTTRQADQVTPAFEAEADELVSHYPVSKRSAALPLLHLWQNQFGFVDDSGVEWIAAKLALTPINILELVTFYPWFRREAAGKTVIRVCRIRMPSITGSAARPRRRRTGNSASSLSSVWPVAGVPRSP